MQRCFKQANLYRRTWNALLILACCSTEAESILGSRIRSASVVKRSASRGLRLTVQNHASRSNESQSLGSSARTKFGDPDIKKEIRALEEELHAKIESTDKLHKDIKTTHRKVVAELAALDTEIDKLHLEFVEKAKAVRGALFKNTVARAAGAEMFAIELDERDARMKMVMRTIGITQNDSLLVEGEMVGVAEQAMSESMFVHGFMTMMADEMHIQLGKLEANATGRRPNVGKVDEELQATMDELHKTVTALANEELLLQEELAHLKSMEDKDISAKKALVIHLKDAIAKLDKDSGVDVSASNQQEEIAQQASKNQVTANATSKKSDASEKVAQIKTTQASDLEQSSEANAKEVGTAGQSAQEQSKQARQSKQASQSTQSKESAQTNSTAAGGNKQKAQEQSAQASKTRDQNAQKSSNSAAGAGQKAQGTDKQGRKHGSAGNIRRGGDAQSNSRETSKLPSGKNAGSAEDDVIGRVWVRPAKPLQQFGLATDP